jgi:hypothetical protein
LIFVENIIDGVLKKLLIIAICCILGLFQLPAGLPASAAPSSYMANGNLVNLTLQPSSQSVGIGKTFNVEVQAQCGNQTTDGIDVFLDFDPNYLAVQSAIAGTSLSTVIKASEWDNAAGFFDFSAGQLGGNLPSGNFTVVTLTFQSKNGTFNNTSVNFHVDSPRKTFVDLAGNEVTGTLTGGVYTITEAPLYLNPALVGPISGNQTFNLEIRTNVGNLQQVDRVHAYLNFDSARLQVAGLVPGSSLTNILENTFSNTAGSISFSAGQLLTPFPTGNFTVATIQFRAEAVTAITSTPVTISLEGENKTSRVDFLGTIIPGLHGDATVQIIPALFPTVTSLTPNKGMTGTTLTMQVNGTNLDGATAVSFPGTSIIASITNVNFAGTQITVNMIIPSDAATGPRNVTVTTSRGTSAPLIGGFLVYYEVPLHLEPSSIGTISGNQTFSLEIRTNAGNLQEVDGVQAYLNFGPSLKVTQIVPGSSLAYVIENLFNNETKSIRYNARQLLAPFPTGNFIVATIQFRTEVVDSGTSTSVNISQAGVNTTSQVEFKGKPISGIHGDAAVQITGPVLPSVGGGGGGGGTENKPGELYIARYLNSAGVLGSELKLTSVNGQMILTLPKGISIGSNDGSPVTIIRIVEISSSDSFPVNAGSVLGTIYDMNPSGATFNPPVILQITYDPSSVHTWAMLKMAYWDNGGNQWITLDGSQVDPEKHQVTAYTGHFSPYAVIAFEPAPTTSQPITPSPVTPKPTVTTTPPVTTKPAVTTSPLTTMSPVTTTLPVTTTPPVTTVTPTTPTPSHDSDQGGISILYVIGGTLGGLLILGTLAGFLWFRLRQVRQMNQYKEMLNQWEKAGYDLSDFKNKWGKRFKK